MEETENLGLPSTSRTHLYTPRTPRMRERQRFGLGFVTEERNEIADNLLEFVNHTWTIFGVSALFGLQQDEVHLKLYAKRLREQVANTLMKANVSYKAKFSLMENVTPRPSPKDPPPIKVEVYCTVVGDEQNVKTCIYKGIFISWRTTRSESNAGNSVRLPLLLCSGTRSCINAVHATLSLMFDCMIIELPAREDDLMWLVPILITPSGREEQPADGEANLVYVVPGLPVTDTISVKFRISDLTKLLPVINDSPIDETNMEPFFEVKHIEKFHKILHTQMLTVGGLNLGLCTLHRIELPVITIRENKIKVTNVETMNRVLLYLNEKAVDTFHTLHFDAA